MESWFEVLVTTVEVEVEAKVAGGGDEVEE